MSKAINLFTRRATALDEFKQKNKKIFDALSELESGLAEARDLVKAEAIEAGHGSSNEKYEAILTIPESKDYDYAKMAKKAKPAELAAIDEKAVIRKIDKKELKKLVTAGVVSPETERAGFTVTKLSPRLIINEIHADAD